MYQKRRETITKVEIVSNIADALSCEVGDLAGREESEGSSTPFIQSCRESTMIWSAGALICGYM